MLRLGSEELRQGWPLPGHEHVREELLAAYGDPGRHYHDLRHLADVLDHLSDMDGAGEPFDWTPVALAAWFHDGVYDGAPDAEERSAHWAEAALADTAYSAEVARLVRLTERHDPAPGDRNGAALCDADLAVLASDGPDYAAYTAAVREEYAHVADADFRAGRAAILRDLLDAPALFRTAHGRAHWEAPARANLAREVAALTADG